MKIISVIGARPQFIKHAALSKILDEKFEHLSIHTGQHYDKEMSQLFFDELKIRRPDFILKNIKNFSGHGAQTGYMLSEIENILLHEKPDYLLVYGDTNSTIAGALAASKIGVSIIHVEAGLRSYNRNMPEEINRVLTDQLSKILLVPNNECISNLNKEGINDGIINVGDVMKDAIYMVKSKLEKLKKEEYILTTIHRPYNTDDPKRLSRILDTLNSLSKKVVLPLHPRTKNLMLKFQLERKNYSNIEFIKAQGYKEFTSLIKYADKIITDSGGVQKEAYFLKTPCITLRSETEWKETLVGNWNQLVFENLEDLNSIISSNPDYDLYNQDLYGKGNTAELIVNAILNANN